MEEMKKKAAADRAA